MKEIIQIAEADEIENKKNGGKKSVKQLVL